MGFRVTLFSENRTRRHKMGKIRQLLIYNIPPIIYKKWSYFFDFQPLSLRNGNKGQNKGHSSGAFVYGLFVNFFCCQAGLWCILPPQKVSYILVLFKYQKMLVDGLLRKWLSRFSDLFCTCGLYFP